MTKSFRVDGATAKSGVAVLSLGLSLLAATLWLGGRNSSTPMAVAAVGGILVARSRHRVVDITEAAPLLETDVPGVRFLIANGALVSFTAHGRTYIEEAMVQRMIQKHVDRDALPESV